jgi:hypothetical protein
MKRVLMIAVLVMTAAAVPGFRCVTQAVGCVCETAGAVASPLFWQLAHELLPYAMARVASQGGSTVSDEAKWRAAFVAGDLLYALLPQLRESGVARPVPRLEAQIISVTCRFQLVSFVVR